MEENKNDLFEEFINGRPQRLCKKCGKCCKALGCRHLGSDNLCDIYENRPEICRNIPYSPWNEIPQGCGFEGWLFQKREEEKQEIRKQKEILISLEIMLKQIDAEKEPEQAKKIKKSIEKIKDVIDINARHGSWDW